MLSLAKLKGQVLEAVAGDTKDLSMSVSVISFGFKFGIPRDADLVFDVRFLPNPYYIAELKEKNVDSLVLGCTHYPLLRGVIGEVMGKEVTLVNPAYETAKELCYVLEDNHLLRETETQPVHKFYVSDGAEKFRRFANTILPCGHLEVEDVAVKSFE